MYNDPNQSNPYQQNPNQPQYQPPFDPAAGQPALTSPPTPPVKKHTKRNIGCLAVVVLIVIVVAISVATNSGGSTAKTTDTAATGSTTTSVSTAKATAKPKSTFATFSDGTFQVGKDVKPGTYRTRTGTANCYYSRLSGFTGALDEVLANDNTDNPAVVTISATDKGFQSTGCGTWTSDLSAITKSKTTFGDGEYIVGTDIAPGTYKSSGQANCYYARLSGFGGVLGEVLANGNTDTSAIVTIAAGDKGFQSTSCGTWTKMS